MVPCVPSLGRGSEVPGEAGLESHTCPDATWKDRCSWLGPALCAGAAGPRLCPPRHVLAPSVCTRPPLSSRPALVPRVLSFPVIPLGDAGFSADTLAGPWPGFALVPWAGPNPQGLPSPPGLSPESAPRALPPQRKPQKSSLSTAPQAAAGSLQPEDAAGSVMGGQLGSRVEVDLSPVTLQVKRAMTSCGQVAWRAGSSPCGSAHEPELRLVPQALTALVTCSEPRGPAGKRPRQSERRR